MKIERTVFVPSGASRQDTAVVLVGTAREYGVDQRSILATASGFWITQALADLVFSEEPAEEPESPAEVEDEAPKKRATKKTSGDRAAKNTTPNEE